MVSRKENLLTCFPRQNQWKKPNNPILNLLVYKDPLKTFYSFINKAEQGEGNEQRKYQGGVARVFSTFLP